MTFTASMPWVIAPLDAITSRFALTSLGTINCDPTVNSALKWRKRTVCELVESARPNAYALATDYKQRDDATDRTEPDDAAQVAAVCYVENAVQYPERYKRHGQQIYRSLIGVL